MAHIKCVSHYDLKIAFIHCHLLTFISDYLNSEADGSCSGLTQSEACVAACY